MEPFEKNTDEFFTQFFFIHREIYWGNLIIKYW